LPDIVDAQTRSRMMSGIRGKDTKPDLAFPKYRAVLLIHGCFWHGHDCDLFRMPDTRQGFWQTKINSNRERDAKVRKQLDEAGWRHMTVWECAIRGPGQVGADGAVERVSTWLVHGVGNCELRGASAGSAP
jgi:DNA mismatch endonuclease (patch repair protein)